MGVIVPVTFFTVVAMGCLCRCVLRRNVVVAGLCRHHLAVGHGHRGQHARCHGRAHQAAQDQKGNQQQGQGAAHGGNDTAAVGLVPSRGHL